MGEIPSVDELAEVIGQAQSGGQPLSAEQLASVIHGVIMAKRRANQRERKRRSDAARRERARARELMAMELAHAS